MEPRPLAWASGKLALIAVLFLVSLEKDMPLALVLRMMTMVTMVVTVMFIMTRHPGSHTLFVYFTPESLGTCLLSPSTRGDRVVS